MAEQHPLLQSNDDSEVTNNRNWNQVIMVSTLAASAGLFVVGATYTSGLPVTNSAKAVKTMELAKTKSTVLYASYSLEEKTSLFEQFKVDFDRSYSDSEVEERFSNFLAFLDLVDEMNLSEKDAGGSAVHGINIFADWSVDEFKSRSLGYKSSSISSKKLAKKTVTAEAYKGKETIVDWRGIYTTKIKNQGMCGSCWAFSTAEQLESDSIRQGLMTTSDHLGPQQLVSCDSTSYGCDGGDTVTAYEYIQQTGGLERERKYSYTSQDGGNQECKLDGDEKFVITVDDYHILASEKDMVNYVQSRGPLSVCLSAEKWMTYTGGVLTYCGNHLPVDHCVQVVGVNNEENYWIVRNQWSVNWGIDGYIYIQEGKDTCQISAQPTYVDVSAVDN